MQIVAYPVAGESNKLRHLEDDPREHGYSDVEHATRETDGALELLLVVGVRAAPVSLYYGLGQLPAISIIITFSVAILLDHL